jgi:hypothetical protein
VPDQVCEETVPDPVEFESVAVTAPTPSNVITPTESDTAVMVAGAASVRPVRLNEYVPVSVAAEHVTVVWACAANPAPRKREIRTGILTTTSR